ncbi:MAG: hypothetical protein ACKO3P_09715, partial [Planctomycetaceae bacterium]
PPIKVDFLWTGFDSFEPLPIDSMPGHPPEYLIVDVAEGRSPGCETQFSLRGLRAVRSDFVRT